MTDKRDLVERVARAVRDTVEAAHDGEPNCEINSVDRSVARAAITETLEALDEMAIGPEHTFVKVFASAHNIILKKDSDG